MANATADEQIEKIHEILNEHGLSPKEVVKRITTVLYGEPAEEPEDEEDDEPDDEEK